MYDGSGVVAWAYRHCSLVQLCSLQCPWPTFPSRKHGGDVVLPVISCCDKVTFKWNHCIGYTFTFKLKLHSDQPHSLPPDILSFFFFNGKPATLDLSVTLPLNSNFLLQVGVTAGGAAAKAAKGM